MCPKKTVDVGRGGGIELHWVQSWLKPYFPKGIMKMMERLFAAVYVAKGLRLPAAFKAKQPKANFTSVVIMITTTIPL